MKSIVEHLLKGGLTSPVTLYWGVPTAEELYLSTTCQQWETQDSNFRYIPVVSEPHRSPDWQGRTGLVGHAVLEDLDDLSACDVIVAGSPAMVYATFDELVAAGARETHIRSDMFSYAPR